jgi:UDP-N-acetylglucosamine--N-acetylmuramyl-(pentapeptide) pyrophosphoryl-undecaprenol N-acetylglucosamine transferase
MERFFPADRIMLTGNPVRKQMLETDLTREQAINSLGLNPKSKTVLIVGGSLGARTLNESVLTHLDEIKTSGVQFIWQTGKYYHGQILDELKTKGLPENLKVMDFITDMGAAYRAADLVISRAGASSVSEFCLIGKPVIMVPSPNVTEDHQTKNAMALVNKQAALIVRDADAKQQLIELAIKTVEDDAKLRSLSENVLKLALPDSANVIALAVIKIANQ